MAFKRSSPKDIASTPPPSFLGRPLRDVFPPGLQSSSASGSCGSAPGIFSPADFYDTLTRGYGNHGHVEQTVVKSAWYYKQVKSARHEFIVLQVEDLAVPGLRNYLVIDRNRGDAASRPSGGILKLIMSLGTDAQDAFRVSYDGNLAQLFHDCQLGSHKELERIDFKSEEPLLLHQLATLVREVSNRSLKYHPVDANCYWFAGLVWEGMREMRPGAILTDFAAKRRGKIGFIRFITNRLQVKDVVRVVQKDITAFESKLPASKNNAGDAVRE